MLRRYKVIVLLALTVLLLALANFVIMLTWRMEQLISDTDAAVVQIRVDEQRTAAKVDVAIEQVSVAAATMNATAGTLRSASQQQVQYWNKASQDADKTVAAVRLFVSLTNRRFNDDLIPQVMASVKQMGTAADEVSKVADGLQPTVTNLALTSLQLKNLMADPNWSRTLANVQVMTGHGAEVSKSVDKKLHSKKIWVVAGVKAALDVAWKAVLVAGAL